MEREEFWAAIAEMRGAANDAGVSRLQEHLTRQGADAKESFGAMLHDHLEQLDLALKRSASPSAPGHAFTSHDHWLAVRCAIVAAGPAAWAEARDQPLKVLERHWDLSGWDLLWALAVEPEGVPRLGASTQPWVALNLGDSQLRPRFVFELVADMAARKLSEMPQLRTWGERTGVADLYIDLSVRTEWKSLRSKVRTGPPNAFIERQVPRADFGRPRTSTFVQHVMQAVHDAEIGLG